MHCHFEKSIEARFGVYNQHFADAMKSRLDYSWIEQTRKTTAKFVLDEYPTKAIEDFGVELIKEDVFGLPFPSCYFEWSFKGNNQSILAQDHDENRIMGWWAGRDCQEGWGASAPVRFQKNKLRDFLKENKVVNGYARNAGMDWLAECAETLITELAACVALLACKGIEKTVISPPESVNRKREKDGRSPLPAYTIIRLARYRKAHGGGTHASPVPHFRRGHVRTLQSGQKTLVRPAIVMAEPEAMPTYKMAKQ